MIHTSEYKELSVRSSELIWVSENRSHQCLDHRALLKGKRCGEKSPRREHIPIAADPAGSFAEHLLHTLQEVRSHLLSTRRGGRAAQGPGLHDPCDQRLAARPGRCAAPTPPYDVGLGRNEADGAEGSVQKQPAPEGVAQQHCLAPAARPCCC